MKFFNICEVCNTRKFFIKKRDIKLPTGPVATSRKLMCGGCYKSIKSVIK